MLTLSHQNHFRFGYNGIAFNWRAKDSDLWWVDYGRVTRAPLPFGAECVATAKTIRESTDLKIWVLLSGGMDSEVVLRAFHWAGIPVQAAIARFENDLNVHDWSHAVLACETLGVPYSFFDLNLEKFWQSEGKELARRSQCISPQLTVTMWLMDQVDGYPVVGGGDCFLVNEKPAELGADPYSSDQGNWLLWEREKVASWYRYLLNRDRAGCAGFFQFTPEIMLAFLREEEVRQMVLKGSSESHISGAVKARVYQKYFNLISRKKYTGYEKAIALDKFYREELEKLFPFSNSVAKIHYADLIRKLMAPEAEVKGREAMASYH